MTTASINKIARLHGRIKVLEAEKNAFYDAGAETGLKLSEARQRLDTLLSELRIQDEQASQTCTPEAGSCRIEDGDSGKLKITLKRRSINALNRLVDAINDSGWPERLKECGSCPVVTLLRQVELPFRA